MQMRRTCNAMVRSDPLGLVLCALLLIFSILSQQCVSCEAARQLFLPEPPSTKLGQLKSKSSRSLRHVVLTSAGTALSTTNVSASQSLKHIPRRVEAAWMSGLKNSLASALAAASSKLLLAPLDTIKTLQQCHRVAASPGATGKASLSLVQAAKMILERPKGIVELYAGVGVAMVGAMPSVGLYFGIYSFCKKSFHSWDPNPSEQRQIMYIAMSAAIGNTIASASRVPYEVIKQKLQTKAYETAGDALRDLSMSTLFPVGGIAAQMLRDIPYAVVTLLTYEHLKKVWKPRAQERFPSIPTRSWDLLVGGLAGGVGSFVTNPADVIKTRVQTDSSTSAIYGGSIQKCAVMIWQQEGPTAFLRGSVPRLLHKVPANAFFFLFYELFRSVFNVRDDVVASQVK